VVAFVQQATLRWPTSGRNAPASGATSSRVDALLSEASDKVAGRVAVKLAAAKVAFQRKYGEFPEEVQQAIRHVPQVLDADQEDYECPTCGSVGIAEDPVRRRR
jgi:hypothetical protein